MIISRLALKNWKNFREVDVPLARRVFLVGPNASGKSNLLDALRFLHDLARPGGGLQKSVADRGGLARLRCLAARRETDVAIEAEVRPEGGTGPVWRYMLSMKQDPAANRNAAVASESVYRDGVLIVSRPDEQDRTDPVRLTQTHLEQINANREFRPVAEFLSAISYLHLVPQLLRFPEAFAGEGMPEDPFGRHFLEKLARTNARTRKSRLRKIESALSAAVPQLKELRLEKDALGVPHLEAKYEHWRTFAARQDERQFSDGTLRLVGLLWAILEEESLLLLEEPELSLHQGIVRRLPALIWRLQMRTRRQVVMSTHSGDLLSDPGIGGEEVLLLHPGPEGTNVRLASSLLEVRRLLEAGHTIGDVVTTQTEPRDLHQLKLF